MTRELERVYIESAEDLRQWLKQNHAREQSIWLVRWKKGSGNPYVSYDKIVDQCLCFGWVDSLPRKLDDQRTMLRITPRNPKSNWSKLNKERVQRLMDAGVMGSSGLEAVEHAKRTGTWFFLDDVEAPKIPEDFHHEFKRHPDSERLFDRFPPSSKWGILEWIKSAKTESTRRKRIHKTAAKASRNIKANHPKGRDQGPPDHQKD